MTRSVFIPSLSILAIALTLAAPAEAVTVERDYLETFAVSSGDRLELEHGDGDVRIEPWEKDELEIRVRYRAEFKGVGSRSKPDFTVEFEQTGNTVRVVGRERVDWKIGIFIERRLEYVYEISAPAYLALDLRGDDGDVEVTGWRGNIEGHFEDGNVDLEDVRTDRVRIRAEDGDVTIRGLEAALDLSLEDGDLELADCTSSPLEIQAEDGDIEIDRCRGDFELAADDGDVTVRDASVGKLSVRTSDGNVSITLAEARDLDVRVRAEDGNVSLAVPAGASATFEIETDDGRISVANEDWVRVRRDDRVTGQIGAGEGRIEIETEDGSASLR